ncbi:MAG: Eco57I restriction-modification methylase domain-containing protein [Acidobacteriota bacterium]|nr:Eco57I restriction-modification methylase domain-containing protein [Acidobacteriota bacterium]
MKLNTFTPKKVLNKAFLKQRPLRSEIEDFKSNLKTLLSKVEAKESEENKKNHVRDFLLDTYYKGTNEVNTKDRKDLVIHLDKTNESKVGVIIEAKTPVSADMVRLNKLNTKAFHELVLYYFDERKTKDNSELKNLAITNIYEWFIFDANVFDKQIYRNTKIKNLYQTKINDKKDNPFFYEELRKIIENLDEEITCTYFDLKDYETVLNNDDLEDDKKLIELYKILSTYHLLKEPFAEDSNALNKPFYDELLHIIGLEEVKVKSKSIIRRKEEGNRDQGSLIENAITILKTKDSLHKVENIADYGKDKEERYYNVALELCIIWINRILFLKLLEAQLVNYQKGNKEYRFLNVETISEFDELFILFHQVLAKTFEDRNEFIKEKYKRVPYLNSSLFEISELEDQTFSIESLKDSATLGFNKTTILKKFKAENKTLTTLEYLFKFLDAYDFASEGFEDVQDDNRSLINASVLGKVFEKINGYKDGSIFTPGFITMYMCRQAIRLAVIQKFKDKYEIDVETFDDLKNFIGSFNKAEKILEYNELINSLHLCDPAVGSGHFLVSSLNEIIAIKCELGILADEKGVRLSEYEITIENDELILTDEKGDIFEYQINEDGKPTAKAQRLQKTLFHEKQTLIENCLFGVDINPNSVKICRLRLWIELLKNAYYRESSNYTDLETLPNIDINIKEGNSLLSRFSLDEDLKKILKTLQYSIEDYRNFVLGYKETRDREKKREFETKIRQIKNDFKTQLFYFSPERRKLADLENQLKASESKQFLFGEIDAEKAKRLKAEEVLKTKIVKAKDAIKQIEENAIYKNAFEWRFEFPEVLDNEGNFLGFDIVIGNPPYGAEIPNKSLLKELFPNSSYGQIDTYKYFIELSFRLCIERGFINYITSDSYLEKKYFKDVRTIMSENSVWLKNIKLGDDIFEDVNLPTAIFILQKGSDEEIYSFKDVSDIKGNDNKAEELKIKDGFIKISTNEIMSFVNKTSIIDETNCKKLIDIFDQVMGVKVYQVGKGKPKQSKYEIENDIFISNEKIDENYYPFIAQGIERYGYRSQGEYIKYGKWLAEPRKSKYFVNPKVVIREIVNPRIFATYIEKDAVVKNIAAVIIEKDKKFSLKYLLGLLNSNLFTYYLFEQTSKSSNKSYPSFTSGIIKNLPIKKITPEEQKPFIKLVDEILEKKKLGQETADLEKKIDAMVYRLYDLTDEEIAIVEGKEK